MGGNDLLSNRQLVTRSLCVTGGGTWQRGRRGGEPAAARPRREGGPEFAGPAPGRPPSQLLGLNASLEWLCTVRARPHHSQPLKPFLTNWYTQHLRSASKHRVVSSFTFILDVKFLGIGRHVAQEWGQKFGYKIWQKAMSLSSYCFLDTFILV